MFKAYSKEDKIELAERMKSIVGSTVVEKGFMSASMLPYENIMGGAKLLSQLDKLYDGNVKLMLAGYVAMMFYAAYRIFANIRDCLKS